MSYNIQSPSTSNGRDIKTRRVSTDSLKTTFRRKFNEHLKESRHMHLNKLRKICDNFTEDVKFKNIQELKMILTEDLSAQELFQNEKIYQELVEIEREIYEKTLQEEGELHEDAYRTEIESIVDNLMSTCQICGEYVDPSIQSNFIPSNFCTSCYSLCTQENWSQ